MYTVYKITNNINNRYFIGVHKTSDPHDSYMGSGLAIKRAIESYGIDNFTKDILFVSETRETSYNKEKEMISECMDDPLCYNISYGGDGGWDYYNERMRPHRTNPMKDPSTARKNLEARKKNETPESIEHRSKVGRANIKKAIEYIFDVRIKKINSLNIPPKKRRVGKFIGNKTSYKKVIIKLYEEYTINLFPET